MLVVFLLSNDLKETCEDIKNSFVFQYVVGGRMAAFYLANALCAKEMFCEGKISFFKIYFKEKVKTGVMMIWKKDSKHLVFIALNYCGNHTQQCNFIPSLFETCQHTYKQVFHLKNLV